MDIFIYTTTGPALGKFDLLLSKLVDPGAVGGALEQCSLQLFGQRALVLEGLFDLSVGAFKIPTDLLESFPDGLVLGVRNGLLPPRDLLVVRLLAAAEDDLGESKKFDAVALESFNRSSIKSAVQRSCPPSLDLRFLADHTWGK